MTPLRKDGFTFKRFFIAHDKSPMKVTTDSCLLGAWAPIDPTPKRVLDIGCGCGIIALMLAQRLEGTNSIIDAIDIEPSAVNQCIENIENSPFCGIKAQCLDINQYSNSAQQYYDLIVTNPPYFASAVDCRNDKRQQARYTETLNHLQLVTIVKQLLTPQGQFCLVLPYHLSESFKALCEQHNLYLVQQLDVRYTADKPFSLCLLGFSLNNDQPIIHQALSMRDINHSYTKAFRQLLGDFYLFRQ